MNGHRNSASIWTPNYEFVEDIARILNVSSASLLERLCPIDTQRVQQFRSWLLLTPLTETALQEIRQTILLPGRVDLAAIEHRFDRLLGVVARRPAKHSPVLQPDN